MNAPITTATEFLAAAREIAIRAMRIPMANSRFEQTEVTPEGWESSFKISKLDLARFARTLANPPARVSSDCMGRVTVSMHGWTAEFSARGVILARVA